ncbi:MAG TPA: hypothetical protein PLB01_04605 [Thermoanaerobaculia bacterium]|nr:hypothetical protein [Thermoanaerobaculia bacterium]
MRIRTLALVGMLILEGRILAGDELPIANWPSAPYWSPTAAREARSALAAVQPLPFIALTPCRIVDTRGNAPLTGGFLPAATVRSYTVTNVCGIPPGAKALSLNATVVHPTGPGFLTLYPEGGTFPPVSTLNYLGNDVIVNAAVVPLSATGGISMALGVSGGDVILDTNGYYAAVPSVTSLNALSGDLTLAAGTNVTLTPSGSTLTISAAGGGGGGGTVTSVGTGSGLTGGPITTTGTVSVAPLGITTGMLANNAVTSAKLANGAVGLSQIDTSQVQARVAACPPGTTVRSVNADGTVVCRAPVVIDPMISTVDGASLAGQYSSIAIGSDGRGLISYHDGLNGDLRVAHCSDAACTSATTTTLDAAGVVGQWTSITIGSDGLGLISYYDVTNGNLKVAHCSNTACTSATTSVLDSAGNVGLTSSIAIGTDGLGLISYHGATDGDLKVAHCSNAACSAATITLLDTPGGVGLYTSLAIGSDGLGLISYFDNSNDDLKVAHCSNTACTNATITTLDSAGIVGSYTSITIGADGLGLISYFDNTNNHLKVAHCSNVSCTAATMSTLDSAADVGRYTSITIGADGLGLISYADATNSRLKVAHCSNTACTSATTSIVAGPTQQTSIKVGPDGLGLISYFDSVGFGSLKVARMGTGGASVNGLTGPVTISGGGGTTVTSSGNTLTITAPTAPPAWGLTGNAGTTPGANFLGTTDGQPLVIQAGGGVGVNKSAPSATLDVAGTISGASSSGTGVVGSSSNPNSTGVYGLASASTGFSIGVRGDTASTTGIAIWGYSTPTAATGFPVGVEGRSDSPIGVGVNGFAAAGSGVNYGIRGATNSPSGWAGYFLGNVSVIGTLSKSGGSFRIDHPLDPENKYLYHSFVESPDMMNIYNGNVTTDEKGYATVELPAWFEALNRDFRYQLTVIGQFAQAIVSSEIETGRFVVRTDKPAVKVSWQVTGIRKDAWAENHRIPVEEVKPEGERGRLLHPKEHGRPVEDGIAWRTPLAALEGRSSPAERSVP